VDGQQSVEACVQQNGHVLSCFSSTLAFAACTTPAGPVRLRRAPDLLAARSFPAPAARFATAAALALRLQPPPQVSASFDVFFYSAAGASFVSQKCSLLVSSNNLLLFLPIVLPKNHAIRPCIKAVVQYAATCAGRRRRRMWRRGRGSQPATSSIGWRIGVVSCRGI
jgi:hypothetical protein